MNINKEINKSNKCYYCYKNWQLDNLKLVNWSNSTVAWKLNKEFSYICKNCEFFLKTSAVISKNAENIEFY